MRVPRWRSSVGIMGAALLSFGCGTGAAPDPVNGVLEVVATEPADMATGVERDITIRATLNELLTPDTATNMSVTVRGAGSTELAGTVAVGTDANTVTFTPETRLVPEETYSATLTTGIQSPNGATLEANFTWSFTIRERAWGTPELIEQDETGEATDPRIGMDDSGNAIVVWRLVVGTTPADTISDLWSSRYTVGGGWESPEQVESRDGLVSAADLAVAAGGDAVATWPQNDETLGVHIWSNRYATGDGWGTAEIIDATEGIGNTAIALDSLGNVFAAWNQPPINSIWSNRYTPAERWGTAELLEASDADTVGGAVIAADASGNATAVWPQGVRLDIWSSRFTPQGGWGTPELIESDDSGNALFPDVEVDSDGNVMAIWEQSDGVGRESIWANRYAGESWGTAELVEQDNTGDARSAQVAIDPGGNVVAVWSQSDGLRDNIWSNRYVPGDGWGTAERIEADNGGNAQLPRVAVDAKGHATVVWQQSGTQQINVWTNRYTPGEGWGIAERIEEDDSGTAGRVRLAMEPGGDAIAVWRLQLSDNRADIWVNGFD